MSEETKPDIAAELAALKEAQAEAKARAEAAEKKAAEAQEYMESVKKAATGKTAQTTAAKPSFVDALIEKGQLPIEQLVDQRLAQKAYYDGLSSKFDTENPTLQPFKNEVFGMANGIVHQNAQQGKQVDFETALKAATSEYSEKQKRMLKLAGADVHPGGTNFNRDSRYAGSETDYFAMSDKEFAEVMKQKDGERKKRQRDGLAYYGAGR